MVLSQLATSQHSTKKNIFFQKISKKMLKKYCLEIFFLGYLGPFKKKKFSLVHTHTHTHTYTHACIHTVKWTHIHTFTYIKNTYINTHAYIHTFNCFQISFLSFLKLNYRKNLQSYNYETLYMGRYYKPLLKKY